MPKKNEVHAAFAAGELGGAKNLLFDARSYLVSTGEHMWCTGSNSACIICKITAFLGDVCPTRTMNSPDLIWPEEKQ